MNSNESTPRKPGYIRASDEPGTVHVIPAARQLTGYQGILILGDRGSGKSVAVTLWESERAMRESEEAANKLRSEASEAGSEEIVSVERFEVLIDERDS